MNEHPRSTLARTASSSSPATRRYPPAMPLPHAPNPDDSVALSMHSLLADKTIEDLARLRRINGLISNHPTPGFLTNVSHTAASDDGAAHAFGHGRLPSPRTQHDATRGDAPQPARDRDLGMQFEHEVKLTEYTRDHHVILLVAAVERAEGADRSKWDRRSTAQAELDVQRERRNTNRVHP